MKEVIFLGKIEGDKPPIQLTPASELAYAEALKHGRMSGDAAQRRVNVLRNGEPVPATIHFNGGSSMLRVETE